MSHTSGLKQIPMVDLQGQYQRLQAEIDPALAAVLESCYFDNGGPVREFAANLSRLPGRTQSNPMWERNRCATDCF